ncbi:MAG: peptidoglycan-associated lipoprotein Pal [Desulfovibrionaceae bacterium]|nr:peptidoglycan-associated lipoprotein Pal [Desulfovibrionaceae bacterium]
MKGLKNLGLVLAVSLVLGIGAGCAKKTTEVPAEAPVVDSAATAVDMAAQTITDGIVYFDFDKYDVKPEYREMLRQKAELMRQYPSIRVRIEGNCDERGTQEYNLALGERRARAAYEYMVMLGVNPSQLEMISYGKERPAVQGTGEQAWSMNRRDDFRVIAR